MYATFPSSRTASKSSLVTCSSPRSAGLTEQPQSVHHGDGGDGRALGQWVPGENALSAPHVHRILCGRNQGALRARIDWSTSPKRATLPADRGTTGAGEPPIGGSRGRISDILRCLSGSRDGRASGECCLMARMPWRGVNELQMGSGASSEGRYFPGFFFLRTTVTGAREPEEPHFSAKK